MELLKYMLISYSIVVTWFLIGAMGTNLMWVLNHYANKIRKEPYTVDEYVRGIVLGTICGPFTTLYTLKKAKEYDKEWENENS